MIDPANLLAICRKQGINYFVGVPDSLLKDFCAYVNDHVEEDRHVITANEGNAIGMAAGWYLGAGEPALVYMQDSGIGNSINPLISLADPEVYSIPMLLIVGWRGAPGSKDEPQHIKQGRIMPGLLEALEIPYFTLDAMTSDVDGVVSEACDIMRHRMTPVVILIKPGTFSEFKPTMVETTQHPLSREDAIKIMIDCLGSGDLVVSTTGKTSRELYEYRRQRQDSSCTDFMTVGSMGHASSIAMGLATARPDGIVVCLDGDGSVVMHMGSMAIIGQEGPRNLVHVVLNNGAHESVGGQPTVGFGIDLAGIAKACGYRDATSVSEERDISQVVQRLRSMAGPVFLEIRVNREARRNLGRPNTSPIENRDAFMANSCVSKRW